MQKKHSIYCILLIAIIEFYLGFFYYPKYNNTGSEASISWDVSGYYMYLPAIFIYNDIKHCRFKDDILKKYKPTPDFQQAFQHSSGNYVMKYSSGLAIIFSPAFFTAHLYCILQNTYPADGFSFPYQLAISIWTFVISIFGLFILRKILLIFFDEFSVCITLISIALISNYTEYAAISGGLSHNSLFTVYVLIIFFTIRFYKTPKLSNAIYVGILCGLAMITRPTEIISLIIPILWGIGSILDIKNRLFFFYKNIKFPIALLISFILVGSIQLLYWKYVSGSYLVYSYQDQGFDWLHTHIINCLFSVRAGWITYSPVFILAIIGIYITYKNQKNIFWACFIFCGVFTYLCFSWSEWWYGWSLGQRAMIQSYPIWAFFLTAFYQWIFSKKNNLKIAIYILLLVFTYYNFWLIHQCHKGGLFKGPEMTREYFWRILGRYEIEKPILTLLDNKYYFEGIQKNTDTIYKNNFENDTSANILIIDSTNSNKVLLIDKQYKTSERYTLKTNKLTNRKWFKISADIRCIKKEWNTWEMPQFIFQFKNNDLTITENMIRIDRLLEENEVKRIYFFAKKIDKEYDSIDVFFNNKNSDKSIMIDNLMIENFEE